jgi:hypothetical protein
MKLAANGLWDLYELHIFIEFCSFNVIFILDKNSILLYLICQYAEPVPKPGWFWNRLCWLYNTNQILAHVAHNVPSV